jgi:hypothetical protein
MRTALSGILAALLLAAALLSAAPAAADPVPVPFAPDTTCTGSLGAITVPGKLVVPAGATCTLTGTRVLGSIEVGLNATLRASRTTVSGDLLGNQARLISVTGASYVTGHTLLAKGVTATFSGSTAFGGIELSENSGRATLTSATVTDGSVDVTKNRGGATVHSNRVNANLLVEENAAGTSVRSNTIGDNLAVHKNTGGTVIASNRASDNIDCADNVPAPTGSGNVAGADGNGAKTGQCAGL